MHRIGAIAVMVLAFLQLTKRVRAASGWSDYTVCTSLTESASMVKPPPEGVDAYGHSFASVDDAVDHLKVRAFADPRSHYFSCIDEREFDPIFGTPGGDFAEFLLALNVYREAGGDVSSYKSVEDLLFKFLHAIHPGRKFYFHSDKDAETLLYAAVQQIVGYPINHTTILRPNEAEKAALRTLLVQPKYHGCGHVKNIMLDPAAYKVNSNITQWMIRAYFEYLWTYDQDGKKLVYLESIMEGQHFATGILQVSSPADADSCHGWPMISPRQGERALFLHSPDAVQVLRTQLSTFFGYTLGVDPDLLLNRTNEIGNVQLGETVSRLAGNLPIYKGIIHMSNPSGFKDTAAAAFWPLLVIVIVFVVGGTAYGCMLFWKRRNAGSGTEMGKTNSA